jgi:hypothetical protein
MGKDRNRQIGFLIGWEERFPFQIGDHFTDRFAGLKASLYARQVRYSAELICLPVGPLQSPKASVSFSISTVNMGRNSECTVTYSTYRPRISAALISRCRTSLNRATK